MIIIDYVSPPHRPKRFETLAPSVILGRPSAGQPVDLDLTPDTSVSRRHARLSCEQGSYWLEDLNSKYGTWVNGRQITAPIRLLPGDKIQLGRTTLEIRAAGAPNGSNGRSLFLDQTTKMEAEPGIFGRTVSAVKSPPALLLGKEPDQGSSLAAIRRRLTVFYELGTALGAAQAVEPTLKTVVEFLCEAIPGAHRGALLLCQDQGLVMKAYFPEPIKPSVSLNLARLAMEKQEAFTWRNGAPGMAGRPFDSVIRYGTQAAMYVPLIWQSELLGLVLVDNFDTADAFDDEDLGLLVAMANQVAMFIKNYALQEDLRRQEVIRSNLMRQFSPQVVEHLEHVLHERGDLGLGGTRAEPVTILVSDVHGFTALTADMEPADVVDMLNELFEVCIPIIFKYNGTVDKYVGDAILAVFGSPGSDDHQWESAVKASLEMQQAISRLEQRRQRRGLPAFQVGIGIHTGAVLHGFIGSKERMEYTVIGDAVNKATRYCHGAGRGEVIISPAVYERVRDLIETIPKTIQTKHPETEFDMEAYVVKGLCTGSLERPRQKQTLTALKEH